MTKHRVHFYKINTIDRDINQVPETFEQICSEVVNLPVSQKSLELTSGASYRLNYFERKNDHYRGKIVKFRTDQMITGSTSDDELLDFQLSEGKKFTEVSHFIYSPQTGILTLEYNHSGVRHGMFMRYLNAAQATYRSDSIMLIAELLMHPDVIQKIEEARRIKSLTIGMPVSKIPSDLEQHNLIKGLLAGSKFGNPGQVSLTLTGAKKRGDTTPLISTEGLMTAISNKDVDLDIFGKVDIEIATDFGSEVVNLLENKLEAFKEWTVPISNENANRWFDNITEMYQGNLSVLRVASDNHAE